MKTTLTGDSGGRIPDPSDATVMGADSVTAAVSPAWIGTAEHDMINNCANTRMNVNRIKAFGTIIL